MAPETGIGQKFAKTRTLNFWLENFDQVCKVSAKLIFEKRKFLDLLCWNRCISYLIREKKIPKKIFTKNNSGHLVLLFRDFRDFWDPGKIFNPDPRDLRDFRDFSKNPWDRDFLENPRDFCPRDRDPGDGPSQSHV